MADIAQHVLENIHPPSFDTSQTRVMAYQVTRILMRQKSRQYHHILCPARTVGLGGQASYAFVALLRRSSRVANPRLLDLMPPA